MSETKKETKPKAEKVELKEGNLDIKKLVEMTATESHPYEAKDAKVKCSPMVAEKGKSRGWLK